ncbi:LysR family transcriptional regulator [Porticoccus sp. W117]|uniref:LysR family transcriptional regulator n=1 Tax=Porticoccus sp. W117 TaxID=3054777 RepID=UPI0025947C4D|nr:LysR family transcriptional regulator [Porticoccus sp. W117]MDM3871660.1 LysR family transcriptional regulator [Porticoccus sp. W117]
MDTSLLEAFVVVAEAESFSVAADRLHLTQSAVSKRIALLEQQLDCRLFDRIARTVSLTSSGRELLPRARSILGELQATRQAIADLSGSVSGTLRLAISHHIGLRRLPKVLKRFTREFPDVSIDMAFMDSESAYDNILHGHFELAIITLSPKPHPKVIAQSIWPDELAFVVAPDHPLTETPFAVEQLQNYPAILPELNTHTSQIVTELFAAQHLKLNTTMTTNYLETIKGMVAIGMGWSLLPLSMLDNTVTALPANDLKLERQLGYIHHKEKTLSNAARALIEMLRATGC